jgi:hypothetical protein
MAAIAFSARRAVTVRGKDGQNGSFERFDSFMSNSRDTAQHSTMFMQWKQI